jgi:hypothetical protein
MALISLMIHTGTMGHWFFVLGIELLKRLHGTEVQIITLLIETIKLFRRLVINYPFALLN